MAKAKTPAAGGPTEARALVDLPALSAKAGQLVLVPAEQLQALVDDGSVDTHPDAVAYARGTTPPSELDRAT